MSRLDLIKASARMKPALDGYFKANVAYNGRLGVMGAILGDIGTSEVNAFNGIYLKELDNGDYRYYHKFNPSHETEGTLKRDKIVSMEVLNA